MKTLLIFPLVWIGLFTIISASFGVFGFQGDNYITKIVLVYLCQKFLFTFPAPDKETEEIVKRIQR